VARRAAPARRDAIRALVVVAVLTGLSGPALGAAQPIPGATAAGDVTVDATAVPWLDMVVEGVIRLPLAAVPGTALAFRPKRRGTPKRTPAVVQTQIILTVVGALIMLVVGSSLARAFGIVGAASLIRYRSKIDDPKDAGVMLCCLAVGLASGVGLYGLAVFAAVFLVAALAVIESFEPRDVKHFGLQATGVDDVAELRPKFEEVLRRFKVDYSLRAQSNEALSYNVQVPYALATERVTNAILKLDPKGKIAVEWEEKKPK
jgi:uncharacterized membrane protein YhiD involved in acid resistance